MWPKAFHQALLLFQKNPKKTKQFLKDKRITQQEKKILHAMYLLRDNLNEEVLSLKNSISAPSLYVEIQMNVLLGLASNNLSHFSDAVEYFTKARQLVLQDDSCPVIKFEILLKCFFVYSNLNAVVQMKPLFDDMLLMEAKSQDMKIKKLHASFVYYDQAGEAEKAREALFELECYYPGMNERSAMAHLLTRFMFYVKTEDFDECRKVLDRMKLHRKYNLTENYNFMKLLLNHLTSGDPIYFIDAEFKKTPVLHYMLQVIQSLGLKNISLATQIWSRLKDQSPSLYKDNFVYEGEKNLFSLCLEKHLKVIKQETRLIEKSDDCPYQTTSERLKWVFENSQGPIYKDDLFEFLYGVKPESKDDMLKLFKAIHKFREKNDLNIVSKKGVYSISLGAKSNKAS